MCDLRWKINVSYKLFCFFKLSIKSQIVSRGFYLVGNHMSAVLMSLVPRRKCFKKPQRRGLITLEKGVVIMRMELFWKVCVCCLGVCCTKFVTKHSAMYFVFNCVCVCLCVCVRVLVCVCLFVSVCYTLPVILYCCCYGKVNVMHVYKRTCTNTSTHTYSSNVTHEGCQ